MRRIYPTDLLDADWRCIEPYIRSLNRRGQPRIREVIRYIYPARTVVRIKLMHVTLLRMCL